MGLRAAADDTKWDVYEHNLLSEYHIRYGGWGGIGYYHVLDTYIALFSYNHLVANLVVFHYELRFDRVPQPVTEELRLSSPVAAG